MLAACASAPQATSPAAAPAGAGAATVAAARAFTDAAANEKLIAAQVEHAHRARRFNDLELPYDIKRKLLILKAKGNIYELVAPPTADPGYDLTERLLAKQVDAREMVRYGERLFSSLGRAPLPDVLGALAVHEACRPRGRLPRERLGHRCGRRPAHQDDASTSTPRTPRARPNYYQRSYDRQPFFYRNTANDGFHEALGDAVALSLTPEYLLQVGLIDKVPPASADLGLLMRDALEKIAFLPFAGRSAIPARTPRPTRLHPQRPHPHANPHAHPIPQSKK